MNNKGFTLIAVIGCLVIIGIIGIVSFSMIRGTRSSTLTTLDKVNEKQVINAAKTYVLENNVSWESLEDNNIYTCIKISDMVDNGYLKNIESNNFVKVRKNNDTKVITDLVIVEECN